MAAMMELIAYAASVLVKVGTRQPKGQPRSWYRWQRSMKYVNVWNKFPVVQQLAPRCAQRLGLGVGWWTQGVGHDIISKHNLRRQQLRTGTTATVSL